MKVDLNDETGVVLLVEVLVEDQEVDPLAHEGVLGEDP